MLNDRRLKGYALVLVTFLLGVATGGGVSYASLQHRYARMFRDRPELLETHRLGALSRRLGLDDPQRDRIRGIVEKHGDDRRRLVREMYERCGDKLRASQDAMDDEVRASLRPDQIPRYESLAKERRDRFGLGRP